MKKVLSILLVAVMMMSMCIGANAERRVDPADGPYEAQMPVSFANDNHYTVEIPTSLAEGETGEITISNSALEEGYHVSAFITNLNVNGYIDVTNGNGNSSEIDVVIEGTSAATHKRDGKVCVFPEDGSREIEVRRATTDGTNGIGTFSGVVCFKFDVEPN